MTHSFICNEQLVPVLPRKASGGGDRGFPEGSQSMGTIQLVSFSAHGISKNVSQIHVPTDAMPFLSVEDEEALFLHAKGTFPKYLLS